MNFAIPHLLFIVLAFVAAIISLSVHEFSHALCAYWMGDTTAQRAGRLTLNPLAHIDIFGTVILPLVLVFLNSPIMFGLAKPTPINPMFFRKYRIGQLLVAAAGPLSNFILATLSGITLAVVYRLLGPENLLVIFLQAMVVTNVVLGIFNLFPIPPLDGAKVLHGVLGPRGDGFMRNLERWGPYIFIAFLLINSMIPILGFIAAVILYILSLLLGVPVFPSASL